MGYQVLSGGLPANASGLSSRRARRAEGATRLTGGPKGEASAVEVQHDGERVVGAGNGDLGPEHDEVNT